MISLAAQATMRVSFSPTLHEADNILMGCLLFFFNLDQPTFHEIAFFFFFWPFFPSCFFLCVYSATFGSKILVLKHFFFCRDSKVKREPPPCGGPPGSNSELEWVQELVSSVRFRVSRWRHLPSATSPPPPRPRPSLV